MGITKITTASTERINIEFHYEECSTELRSTLVSYFLNTSLIMALQNKFESILFITICG